MTLPDLPLEGGCRCGRVRFCIGAAPLMEMACHCRVCQQMTSGAFSTGLLVPADAFEVEGETVAGGTPSEARDHRHCDRCKSWLFTVVRARPGTVNVRATLLDDPSWFAPWMETQTAEGLRWAKTGAARSYPRFPPPEELPALLADYRAERRGRQP